MRRAPLLLVLAGAGAMLAVAAAAQNSDGPEGVEPQEPPAAADGREPRAAEAPSRERAEEADEPAAARDEAGTEAPASAPSPDIAALNPLAGLDKGSLAGFRDAPLFTPSRRRPAPPPAVAEAPPPPPPPPPPERAPAAAPELKLAGVVEGPEGAVAIVENGGEIERLRLGDQVDGWLVTGIEGFTLKVTLDDREHEYRMFQRAEGKPAAASGDEDDSSSGDDSDEDN